MKTQEEEILGMLRRLNAISRRQTKPESPAPMNGETGELPPPSEPDKKSHGRGRLVALLMDNGPMVQSQLAAQLGIRPQSLSELICKVEADGMVTRRQSEEDKRQTIVSLTEKGKASVESFRSAHRKHAQDFLAPLTDEEKHQLSEILRKLIDARKEQED
ncbi:MAG: MarR family transcriptional regulator [Clostridia bacterium]|nr:MarR family transcriptional regulator [Clostridia bacterium]